MSDIKIDIQGIEKVTAALGKFPREIAKYLQAAGKESYKRVIIKTPGLGGGRAGYPQETAANHPPTPYYIRGRGLETKHGNKYNSERLGTQWYTKPVDKLNTEIGNRASYAKWVSGDQQARAMGRIGWRKLFDVATEKLPEITRVYQAWVDKLIKDLGL